MSVENVSSGPRFFKNKRVSFSVHSVQDHKSHDFRWNKRSSIRTVLGNQPMQYKQDDKLATTDPELDETHQFGRLQRLGTSRKPFGKMIIKLKCVMEEQEDEDQTVIRNKADLSLRILCSGKRGIIDFEEIIMHQFLAWKHVRDFRCLRAHIVFSNLSDGRKNAFLKWSTKGRRFMVAPPVGFMSDHPKNVYHLRKALFGIKGKLQEPWTTDPPESPKRPGLRACCMLLLHVITARQTKAPQGGQKNPFKIPKGYINMGLVIQRNPGFWMSKKTETALRLSSQRQGIAGVIWQVVSSRWIADTSSRLWLSQYNKYRCTATLSSHSNIHATTATHSRNKAHHTRYHFIKEQRIGMRCLTPADLEVLTNETA
ncbi:hypothetical protein Tco_1195835 [Tanacetum coccineum]